MEKDQINIKHYYDPILGLRFIDFKIPTVKKKSRFFKKGKV